MAEYSKQIYYRLNSATNGIKLYTSVEDVGDNYVPVADNGATVYAALVDPADSNASDVRIRKDGNTFAFAREASSPVFDPDPNLLLARTRAGTHTKYYKVGDAFDIELNGVFTDYMTFDHYACKAVIIGFDHNKDLETGGANSTHLAIGLSSDDIPIAFYGGIDTSSTGVYPAHSCGSNSEMKTVGGWSASDIRTKILPQFFSALPTAWQAVIGEVTKYTDNIGYYKGSSLEKDSPSAVSATVDKLFIPSEYEVFGETYYSNAAESEKQTRYEGLSDGKSIPLRYRHNDFSTPTSFWLRSPGNRSNAAWCLVCVQRTPTVRNIYLMSSGNIPLGILPCFAVF